MRPTRLRHLRVPALVCAIVTLYACAGKPAAKTDTVATDTLTRRQKDSVIGASGLPGASGVTRALVASDSVRAGVRRADSIATDTNP